MFNVECVQYRGGNVAGSDIRTDGGARTSRRHIRTPANDVGGANVRKQPFTPAHLFTGAQHHLGHVEVGVFLVHAIL